MSQRYALEGLMRDVPASIAVLTQLTALRVRLTVDDFGTG
jgi:EAL domain-containing protein (putative c-di-GMP-specific phosphodiesterase class I)